MVMPGATKRSPVKFLSAKTSSRQTPSKKLQFTRLWSKIPKLTFRNERPNAWLNVVTNSLRSACTDPRTTSSSAEFATARESAALSITGEVCASKPVSRKSKSNRWNWRVTSMMVALSLVFGVKL